MLRRVPCILWERGITWGRLLLPSSTRFTVRQHFRTSRILNNLRVMWESGGYTRGSGQHRQPPVSLADSGKGRLFLITVIPELGLIIVGIGFIPEWF